MRDTIIILLKYEEPEWSQTVDSAFATGCPILIADRSGCGSMAGAYNKCFMDNIPLIHNFKYIWFVSNIIFDKNVFEILHQEMLNGIDVIHPSFDSDHAHLCKKENTLYKLEVPFVEFTAPMMKMEIFWNNTLDENMPFVGHDLDWSYRVKEKGHKLFVHHGVKIGHSYLRHNRFGSDITDIRKKIRKSWEAHTTNALMNKYGIEWRKVLKYEGAV